MTNKEKLSAIRFYQNRMDLHPLTCENDSSHDVLEGFVDKGTVKLRCPDCDYVQDFVPGFVYSPPPASPICFMANPEWKIRMEDIK